MTVTATMANLALVPQRRIWVQHLLASHLWGVIPGQEVLEYCALCLKILGPATPFAHIYYWHSMHKMKVLGSTASEGVGAIWPGVKTNIHQIIAQTVQELTSLLLAIYEKAFATQEAIRHWPMGCLWQMCHPQMVSERLDLATHGQDSQEAYTT